ncbi:uncharacterized protein LOC115234438 [Formica exsecta]|uniref:uncharacterized protein LOC115234438 n=1 Tax=Formica exsecta TaxID=72781 RepID=UPI0011444FB2|nr:uncharacterized protein LOC115234438 [Formica exsecta]
MKPLVVLIILFALSAGQVQRLSSSYKNGVKWEFGTNIFHGDILARSNIDQAPTISSLYKNKPIVPIIRKEPVVATVYKKMPVISDIYQKKIVLPTVLKQEPLVQNIRKQQSTVFKAHSVASNIYKGVYKQQAAVPIVRKEQSIVSNIYKSQPIRPVVHHQQQSLQHFVVPGILPADSEKKLKHHVWNYQYNPHHLIAPGNVHVVSHN